MVRFRKHLRRFGTLLLGLATLALAACGGSNTSGGTDSSGKPVVYATFGVLQSIGQEVAGSKLDVKTIVQPGGEVHEYEPKPQDIKNLASAKLLIVNGLGMEHSWLNKLITEYKGPQVVASTGIEPALISEDHFQGHPNPHAWVDPINGAIYARNIAKAFGKIDPANREFYEANAQKMDQELKTIQKNLVDAVDKLTPNERVLVTCEGAFSYLTRSVGMREQYLWAVNSEQEGSPQQVSRVIDFVKSNHVPAVFCEKDVNIKSMDQVVAATGVKFGGILYVESLTGDKPDETISYIQMLRKNTETISHALSGK